MEQRSDDAGSASGLPRVGYAKTAGELTPVPNLWETARAEAEIKVREEPILGSYFHATILNHTSFGAALSFRLASKTRQSHVADDVDPRRHRRSARR